MTFIRKIEIFMPYSRNDNCMYVVFVPRRLFLNSYSGFGNNLVARPKYIGLFLEKSPL